MTRAKEATETVTVHVPFRILKRGGRKEMVLLEGIAQARRADSTLVKALARAFRWKNMLESGEFMSISELAEHEGIAFSYMTRVLRLTLLAPDIVEAIVDSRHGEAVTLACMLEPLPVEWHQQPKMSCAPHDAVELHRRAPPTSAKKNGKHSNERSRRRT